MSVYFQKYIQTFVCIFFFIVGTGLQPFNVFAAPTDQSNALTSEDKRTPFEKYQGAYLAAWLQCVLKQKLIFVIEKGEAKGIPMKPYTEKDTNISICIKEGLKKMKKEYNNILPLVKTEDGKKALLEHYVAAIMHVKETYPRHDEDEIAYTNRMNETQRKTTELWVRFEITQP